jgi:hypothetical protein
LDQLLGASSPRLIAETHACPSGFSADTISRPGEYIADGGINLPFRDVHPFFSRYISLLSVTFRWPENVSSAQGCASIFQPLHFLAERYIPLARKCIFRSGMCIRFSNKTFPGRGMTSAEK